jgi:hypothetical protein
VIKNEGEKDLELNNVTLPTGYTQVGAIDNLLASRARRLNLVISSRPPGRPAPFAANVLIQTDDKHAAGRMSVLPFRIHSERITTPRVRRRRREDTTSSPVRTTVLRGIPRGRRFWFSAIRGNGFSRMGGNQAYQQWPRAIGISIRISGFDHAGPHASFFGSRTWEIGFVPKRDYSVEAGSRCDRSTSIRL